ncbi:UDP-N-acetylmuramoyl-tripeptide--D-alanyl-D-alanine ligase [Phocicoccus pinnipedialis]|uniref:UDP-N-acetylmuramoyl-tripeptide--D-alanyl-D-alanine ligase n=1 Tax=Phocicoccus pinnipedialis TaxID=110845 RepID=A0A6V7R5H1_9BACL|nr:UDP-N-acetylmuramoyl-tripeptide--D-alanyl-D-alanine ligase [Jeotgalicoccus pinnipedialis]MBP1939920.1 UDP-N-acetylmuramoyl-tripeptide--D-alanyl-D-alanine ligase [Jeotgalicoccus pinnipedialis]CAD2072132.1 UDP-N-acetylmuramoyl-tripeptide--D-alanyl-D-alanine ligase [Jeotgalicoccus pinnipedialis]
MLNITIEKLSEFTNGTMNCKATEIKDVSIKGVSIDTRTIEENNLFIPFVGENVDGHKFIEQALESGATIALSEKERNDVPVIVVENARKALGLLAKNYLNTFKPMVIAVTGSNGKTTTKDMIECVLQHKYKVEKTQGNLNNELGMPLTILSTSEETEILILEMGMDSVGDIHYLSDIANPDIAVITSVGESHLEKLGSREKIAEVKYEIVDFLKDDGLFIYSKDYQMLEDIVDKNKPYTIKTVGENEKNGMHIKNVLERLEGTEFTLDTANFKIPQLGRHNALNASYAIMIARELGVTDKQSAEALLKLRVTGMRMEQKELSNGTILINDAYNASPSSMKSAIDTVRDLPYESKVLVLGDILELGSYSEALHYDIATHINQDNNFTHILTFGEGAKNISDNIKKPNSEHFTDIDDLIEKVNKVIGNRVVVLLKASRGMKLERVEERIK